MEHSIGKTIATLRKEKGWTQVELAEKLQVSDKAVSKWERDDACPSIEFFSALAELFGVSIDYIIRGNEVPAAPEIDLLDNNYDVQVFEEIINGVMSDVVGVLNVSEILKTDNLDLIKYALEKYPVNIAELLYKWYLDKKWKELYRYCVDNKYNSYYDNEEYICNFLFNKALKDVEKYIIEDDYKSVEKTLLINWRNFISSNSGKMYFYKDADTYTKRNLSSYSMINLKTLEEGLDLILRCKQTIINEATLKLDKFKSIQGFTKEYFEEKLKGNDLKYLILELWQKFEVILGKLFHCSGDSSEKLNEYISKYANNNKELSERLHKLRKNRNAVAHLTTDADEMTKKELEYCIKYICQWDKEIING